MESFSESPQVRINVAYVEDQQATREAIAQYLQNLGGINIHIQVGSGEELLAQIMRSYLKPDICMVDIEMPGMSGFEVVAAVKRKWPEMKTLVFSGYSTEAYMIHMILRGANGYLCKNCHPKEIKQALLEIHEHEMYYSGLFSPRLISEAKKGRGELASLTEKEMQLLKLIIRDITYPEIAVLMHTSAKSVEGYRNKLFQKLGVKSKVGLAVYAVKFGLVSFRPDGTIE